jgi:hypothetical protein
VCKGVELRWEGSSENLGLSEKKNNKKMISHQTPSQRVICGLLKLTKPFVGGVFQYKNLPIGAKTHPQKKKKKKKKKSLEPHVVVLSVVYHTQAFKKGERCTLMEVLVPYRTIIVKSRPNGSLMRSSGVQGPRKELATSNGGRIRGCDD